MVSNVLLEKVEFSAWNREFSKTLNTFQLHSICGKKQNILAKRIILILFFFLEKNRMFRHIFTNIFFFNVINVTFIQILFQLFQLDKILL